MPTYRISRRGERDGSGKGKSASARPPIQADDLSSALSRAGITEEEILSPTYSQEIEVEVLSPLPHPRVYTAVRAGEREGEVWEGVSSGERERADEEGKKWDGGKGKGVGVAIVDEGVEVNRIERLKRKS